MELTDILRQIDSLKQEAEKLQPVKPELEKVFWDKFRLEFNYNSNHMEGNTLTYGHTQLLLLFDRISGDYTGREIEEMKAHDVALKMVREMSVDPEADLSEKLVREINELILVRPFYNKAITPDGKSTRRLITPGKYKKHPNSVLLQDGGMFYYASPEETPALMGDLIEWYKNEKDKIHPVQLAALFHYKLVRIHPFDDSNGRTTRLVMNYILLKNGYAPIVIESKKKEQYLAALNKADVGDINAFVDYIAGLSIRWQEIYLKAMKGEKIEEPDDFEKEVEILKKRASKKLGPEIEISESVVRTIFTDSLFPLLEKIEFKLSKLQDFFMKNSIIVSRPNRSKKVENFETKEVYFEPFIKDLTNGGDLKIEFIHGGFKKAGTNVFNHHTTIDVNFQTSLYRIQISDIPNIDLEKAYQESLSAEEIENISSKIANYELDKIKKYI